MSSYTPDNNVYISEYTNCPGFLERYLNYLRTNQGKRPLTLSETALLLREFCQYIHYKNTIHEIPSNSDAHKDMGISDMDLAELADVKQTDFEEYVSFLDTVTKNSTVTIRKKQSIIRTFYSYLLRMQNETGVSFPYGNPASGIVIPRETMTEQDLLTVEQVQRILDAVAGEMEYRDRAILMLLATTGITVSELAFIKVSDIVEDDWIRIVSRNSTRYVWLTPESYRALQEYLLMNGEPELFLFPSARCSGQPITTRTVRNIVARAAVDARICNGEVTPKLLRDSFCDILCKVSAPHEHASISQYLGYSLPSMRRTMIASDKRFRENTAIRNIIMRSSLMNLTTHHSIKEETI